MKDAGMLAVSLRGVNYRFWYRLKGLCHAILVNF